MISKHGSPLNLTQLGQYFLSIYNKFPLNADLWPYSTVVRFGTKVAKHKHTKNFMTGVDYGQQISSTLQSSRDLEDNDEDLFRVGRDLDTEELFEREYDLLDERDIIFDLD